MSTKYSLQITGMKCASCVARIEKALSAIPGVQQANVNFATKMATVICDKNIDDKILINTIIQIGYQASNDDVHNHLHHHDEQPETQHYHQLLLKAMVAGIIGILLMVMAIFNWMPDLFTTNGHLLNIGLLALSLATLIYAGRHFYVGSWKALKTYTANMDTLIALGTGIAWLYSCFVIFFPTFFPSLAQHIYLESALIITALVDLGTALEIRARRNTSLAIKKLINLQPKIARLIQNNIEIDVPVETLKMGDLIRIRPGEQIPIDGAVLEGKSFVDESMLTGESMPIEKAIGNQVIGATLNKNGSLIIKINHTGAETVLAKIITLVQHAQNTKPKLARLADQIAAIFVPAVITISMITAIIWYYLGPIPQIAYMLVTSMAVLVIACPCALGLAIPISVMVGVGKAASNGILIRQADALQQASTLTTIVLDKTGTITIGKPTVTGIYPVSGYDQKNLLSIAASLEINSEHPLATAITLIAQEKQYKLFPVTHFQAIEGQGVKGIINNKTVYLGNHHFMTSENIAVNEQFFQSILKKHLGETCIYIAIENQLIGFITLADIIKPDAIDAIQRLKNMHINVVMLTGDHYTVAQVIAKQIGVEDFIADVLPQDKAAKIITLQNKGEKIGMVGDGINDAPALASADVGFAIGTGTDIAIESAGITLMNGSLHGVADAIQLSRQTVQNMKQNLFGAFIYNIIGIPIAAGILYPFLGILLNPMIAAAAMALSSVTVVSNANRLRRFQVRHISQQK